MAENLEAWQDLKFGVIIHWGIYSAIGQGGSWSLHRERLGDFTDPPPDWEGTLEAYHSWYYDQARTFSGDEFDADQWARECAGAGMRYVVFTAKHHDGFCLFDSAYTNLKATAEDAGLGRDVFSEVVTAFRHKGLQTGVYFSKADWSRPEYWDRALPITDRFCNYPDREGRRWRRFVEFTHDQVEELLSNYGAMNVLWLDAGWVCPPGEPIDIPALAQRARELQPGILVVDRTVHGAYEDYRTPEQEIPETRLNYPWESCVTLTRSWCSLARNDQTKPTAEVIENLLAVISRGGNLLLGIGPDATGHMSEHIVDSLREIGAWVEVYADGIYGTRATEAIPGLIARLEDGTECPVYLTATVQSTYAFVAFGDRPAGTAIRLVNLPHGASLLGGGTLEWDDGGASVVGTQRYAVCITWSN